MSVLLVGCGDDEVEDEAIQATSPLEVRVQTLPFSGSNEYVNITAIDDSVTLEGIMLNRGNIKMNELDLKRLPHTLKYGESFAFPAFYNLREVQILTRDKGAWVFTVQ